MNRSTILTLLLLHAFATPATAKILGLYVVKDVGISGPDL